MEEKDLLFEVKDEVALITINRASQRNSISISAIELFHEYLNEIEKDEKIRVLCITGSGDKAFSSGADLSSAMGQGEEKERKAFGSYAELITRISRFSKSTVAKVNGYCLAGGTGFMLACDIVVACRSAKFGTPEVNVGLFPLMIGALIFKNVQRKKAMEMILLGEKITAEDALAMGMITKVVEDEELDFETGKILRKLSKISPIAVKMGKEAFNRIEELNFEEGLKDLSQTLFELVKTDDAKEGIAAFIEKRAPEFKGR